MTRHSRGDSVQHSLPNKSSGAHTDYAANFQSLNWFREGFASGGGSDENDVVVISGGPGGYVATIKEAQLGLKTT
ncbi:dihydrolipoyl dehydrogenase, mitochondrial [Tanacetum coccineum]